MNKSICNAVLKIPIQNGLLKERVALLEHSGKMKDFLLGSQEREIDMLDEIIAKKDAMLLNCDAMMENLRGQAAAERKKQRKCAVAGVGVGVVVGVVLVMVFK